MSEGWHSGLPRVTVTPYRLPHRRGRYLNLCLTSSIHDLEFRLQAGLALAEVAAAAQGRPLAGRATFGREGQVGARKQEELGVFGIRGGDVVGDHTVYLFGAGERLELTHRSQSRECLARGGLRAALWLAGQKPGVYGMRDVLGL